MADSELERTHPATIIVRTVKTLWQLLAGLVVFFFLGQAGDGGGAAPALWLGAVTVLIVGATLASSWVQWAFMRYGLTGHDLLITSGWLVKKRLSIPLARVQGVNLRADPLMRILGLAEVTIETAGGGSSNAEATIGSLRLADAELLRTALLHGRETVASPDAVAAQPADVLTRMSDFRGAFAGAESSRVEPSFTFTLTPARLVLASATSKGVPIALVASLALAAQAVEIFGLDVTEDVAQGLLSLALPVMLAVMVIGALVVIAVAIVVGAVRDYGFVARRTADRIETEAGLLERRMTGTPVRRIQAVRIEAAPLRRLLGYVAVHADTAGFAAQTQDGRTSLTAIVPLARKDELRPIVHGLLPEAEHMPDVRPLGGRSLRFYLVVPTSAAVALAIVLAAAGSVLDPVAGIAGAGGGIAIVIGVVITRWLQWKHAAYGCDEHALSVAWGAVGRYQVRLGRSRIQSLSVRQNPFQRRAGLATLAASSVAGSGERAYRVSHLPLSDAHAILGWYERPRTAEEHTS